MSTASDQIGSPGTSESIEGKSQLPDGTTNPGSRLRDPAEPTSNCTRASLEHASPLARLPLVFLPSSLTRSTESQLLGR